MSFLVSCHNVESDTVGDHRCGIKERAGVRAQKQMIDEPGNEREGYKELEMHRVFQIDQNDVDSTDHKGYEAQKSLVIETQSHHKGCRRKKDLPHSRELTSVA